MGKYVLKTRNGEVIKEVTTTDIDNAIDYFVEMKKLDSTELLKIFLVEKVY